MAGFFDRMLGRNNTNKGSSSIAKDRLKFVLLHERVNISPEKMREMKEEIIAVIAKYVPGIDADTVDIGIEQSDRYDNKIVAEIPFTKSRGFPARDDDENDDLSHYDDDDNALIEASPIADLDHIKTDFQFHDDETVPNPALHSPMRDDDLVDSVPESGIGETDDD